MKAFKLMKIDSDGMLHFPFCQTSVRVSIGRWMDAEDASTIDANGVRRTTLVFRGGGKGRMAPRPGFHCADIPYAAHIGIGGNQRQHHYIGDEDVWCEVELSDEIDYQSEADGNGLGKNGKVNRQKADIRDHVPLHGTYRYKTNPNMIGTWIIGGSMKIIRILYDDYVIGYAKRLGLLPMPRVGGIRNHAWTDYLNEINR